VSDHFGGCPHLPIRFSGKVWLDELDMTVGPAYAVAVSTIRRLLDDDANGLLLSGPVGCGKSVLAAGACNEQA
jgi:DNA replication protein DnaC